MSSKGQIVIPESIRQQLNLLPGTHFVVVGEGDVVVLKAISTPQIDTFGTLIQQARQQVSLSGIKHADINEAVEKSRGQ
jgi:antitoxin PrlF